MRVVSVVAVVMAVTLMACGAGQQGPKGDPGEAGPGLNSTTRYFCTDGSDDYHEIWRWPDGSVMTTCQISWTTDGQTTAVQLWRSDQVGSKTGRCLVGASGPSYGQFDWNGSNASTLTVYGSTTKTYPFTCIQQ